MTAGAAILTEGLTKAFGRMVALDHLDLEVARGEVVGYLGPNGAGKTTTIRLLLGLLGPTGGRSQVMGYDCHHETVEAHRHLAYVPGEASLWPALTGAETLHLLGEIQGRVDSAYRDELVAMFDLDTSKRVRAYSRGNKQKLLLIAGLMSRPEVLILDEPTAGLDPLMEQTFRQCILDAKQRGQTVFLSSHVLSQVDAICDRVAILRSGRLIDFGSLSAMRHLASMNVEIRFRGKGPDLNDVKGIMALTQNGLSIHCQVHGPMQPLIDALAGAEVDQLICREPTLEEMFLAHYGTDTPSDSAPGHVV